MTVPRRADLRRGASRPPDRRRDHRGARSSRWPSCGVRATFFVQGRWAEAYPDGRPLDRRSRAPGRQPLALPCPDAAPDRCGSRDGPVPTRPRRIEAADGRRPAPVVPLPVRRRAPTIRASSPRVAAARVPARRLARRRRRLGAGPRRARDRGRRRRGRHARPRRRGGGAAPRLADGDARRAAGDRRAPRATPAPSSCRIDELDEVPASPTGREPVERPRPRPRPSWRSTAATRRRTSRCVASRRAAAGRGSRSDDLAPAGRAGRRHRPAGDARRRGPTARPAIRRRPARPRSRLRAGRAPTRPPTTGA